MTVKICDMCNHKINVSPMSNVQLPVFIIKKLVGAPLLWVDVDLCPECCKKLEKWLDEQKV